MTTALLLTATAGCGTARQDYIRQLEAQGGGAVPGAPEGGASGEDDGGDPASGEQPVVLGRDPAQVGVQLDTFFGAGAAGMYDAAVSGYYDEVAIETGFLPGTPDEDPIAAVAAEDGPEVLMATVPAVLVARERDGVDLVQVAQLYQRSGSLLIAPAGTPVDDLAALKGSTIGLLGVGNRSLDVRAVLSAAGLEEGSGYDVVGEYDVVFDPAVVPSVGLLRSGTASAIAGTTYDEYAQLLEFGTEDGAGPYTADQLATRNLDDTGDALLGEGLFVRASWLADPGHRDVLVRFLAASFKGYADCRDHVDDCAQMVVDQGAALPVGHQAWGVNGTNALIWPAPDGIGTQASGAWDATVKRLAAAGELTKPPAAGAVDLTAAADARSVLADLDLVGSAYARVNVPLTPGGEGSDPVSPDPDPEDQ